MNGNPNPSDDVTEPILDGRIAIISDIHGNHHALEAVLEAIDREGMTRIVCCGDIVGYGARPNECVETIRERKIPVIAGNHDHACLNLTDISNFNEIAKAAVIWTRNTLKEENTEFLRQMPMTIRDEENSVLYVHASPKDPGDWNYVLTMGDARTNFNYFSEWVCFIGHSHQPFIIENDRGNLDCASRGEITMRRDRRYLVNVGSVGQPRDHNPDACFAVLDLTRGFLEIRRLKYDLEGAQQAILDAGLPKELSERLAHGM